MAAALPVIEALRAAGVGVLMHSGGGSLKSQLQKADASGAAHALIFGDDEVAAGQVTVKALRDGSGAQQRRSFAEMAAWAATLQSQA
jgi:histidyl-tRNA synthetase